jgi:hypothetical protein
MLTTKSKRNNNDTDATTSRHWHLHKLGIEIPPTQIWEKEANEWRIVHIHYSGMPVTAPRRGF